MNEYQSFASRFEPWLEALAKKDRFSGAVLITNGEHIWFEKAYGKASYRYDVDNRVDTRFNLGSMNKMFTGTAILQQVQAGNLKLETRVGDILPEIKNQDLKEKVTIQQLLNHTAGMGSHFNMKFMQSSRELYREVVDFLPLFIEDELMFEPGSRWSYSNSGYMLLGYILENVSGLNYFDLIRRDIYQPAGMTDTDCYDMDLDVPDVATGYTLQGGQTPWRQHSTFMHVIRGGPAGGGISTVHDLNRFANALRNHVLLDEKHTKMLLENGVDTGEPNRQYACGFERINFGDEIICGHGGGFPGINGKLEMYLNSGWTVAVLANYDPPTAEQVAIHLRYWINDEEMPKEKRLDPPTIASLCGEYIMVKPAIPDPGSIMVQFDAGEITCHFPPMGKYTLLPYSKNSFTDKETFTIKVELEYSDSGEAAVLKFKSKGFAGEFHRLGE